MEFFGRIKFGIFFDFFLLTLFIFRSNVALHIFFIAHVQHYDRKVLIFHLANVP